jgi:hypothetical protein
MADQFDIRMRRLDLSVPDKQGQAMNRVMQWLEDESRKRVLFLLSQEELIKQIRVALKANVVCLSNEMLSKQVGNWLQQHGRPSAKPQQSFVEPDFVGKLRRDFKKIQEAFEVKWHDGSGAITVSGPKAKFDGGKLEASVGWDGTLELKTADLQGGVFTASIGPKQWSLTMLIGDKVPDFSKLQTVFQKGDAALRAVLRDPLSIAWNDPSKTKQQFSSQMDDVKSAVETAMKTASLRPGSVHFGISAKGDAPFVAAKDRQGVQVQALLTVVF